MWAVASVTLSVCLWVWSSSKRKTARAIYTTPKSAEIQSTAVGLHVDTIAHVFLVILLLRTVAMRHWRGSRRRWCRACQTWYRRGRCSRTNRAFVHTDFTHAQTNRRTYKPFPHLNDTSSRQPLTLHSSVLLSCAMILFLDCGAVQVAYTNLLTYFSFHRLLACLKETILANA